MSETMEAYRLKEFEKIVNKLKASREEGMLMTLAYLIGYNEGKKDSMPLPK